MHLNAVRISGYRSLYEVSVTPQRLTVLTGPNNSGKTNFVEAIDFLAEVYRHGLEVAISRKGGLENILHRRVGRTRRSLEFTIESTINRSDMRNSAWGVTVKGAQSIKYVHQFVVFPLSQRIEAGYQIESEQLSIATSRGSAPFFVFTRTGNKIETKLDEDRFRGLTWLQDYRYFFEPSFLQRVQSGLRSTDLFITGAFSAFDLGFVDAMRRVRLYQLVPLEGRRPGVPTPNAEADTRGANLPALVSFMKANQPAAWKRVTSAMRGLVPELVEIKTEFTPDRRLALQFVERGLRRPWSAEDVSDGTIQALGMYTALFDDRSSLILFEEPENSLHTWIIRRFIDTCRETKNHQIILTTHSAALLGYLTPNEVSVVWKMNGRTHIKPVAEIDPSITEIWQEGSLSIFEMLDSGFLSQAVPGDEEDNEE